MREWIVTNPVEINAELGADDEARRLITEHHLAIGYNTHASEPRWEVSVPGGPYGFQCMTFFNEYTKARSLGDAVRECVYKKHTSRTT